MKAQNISEIINLLSDDDQSLVKPFLKAQIFAKRVGNEGLYSWVVQEIKGYENESELPSYRKAKSNDFAILKQYGRYTNEQSLPLASFSRVVQSMFLTYDVSNSIKSLEEIVMNDPKGALNKLYGADLCQLLSNDLKQRGLNFGVHSLRTEVQVFELAEILINIRSKLLELMLELEEDFPNIDIELETREIDKKAVNQTINFYMNKIRITTTGDGNTVNTGDNSTVINNAVITKSNKEELKKFLTDNGVSDEDVTHLAEIIDEEASGTTLTKFGPKVGAWIQMMIGKAVSGAWEIGVGAAGSVLAQGILQYYGLA
ncbi:hypothetical protein B0A67_12560 [Flavobacterium aquidurense]|uniref:AbiTii domain-containing protein n=1 Tax=Flavobacterium aquidurense TaxID=362413 RepID=UPI000912A87C|nr:hypothetical protein [Flavobacterium aquidurense]OXA71100.1 hypothetical protein B0A67_12560 [Flavobacterium aquidurense]SHG64136.1 hypothetical protein SAMN05444481_10652 [Flavobacterium frigidimaris]